MDPIKQLLLPVAPGLELRLALRHPYPLSRAVGNEAHVFAQLHPTDDDSIHPLATSVASWRAGSFHNRISLSTHATTPIWPGELWIGSACYRIPRELLPQVQAFVATVHEHDRALRAQHTKAVPA